MNAGQTIVHVIRPQDVPEDSARNGVTPEELDRAAHFRFPADATRWLAFRSQLRVLLADETGVPSLAVPIVLSPLGKPLLASPFDTLHFNLSHCDDLGLLAISRDGPVGIDIEPLARSSELLGCEAGFCHPLEIEGLPEAPSDRARQLLEIWTAKEAVLKAMGSGLIHPPESLRIARSGVALAAISDGPVQGLDSLRIQRLESHSFPNHCAAIAVQQSVTAIIGL